ncbi:MAG TPA: aminomethyl-transferring glycine dehydrogenase [Bacteroidales bacterium]|nr:aminomethyl-transferring glycine dehydrogenase [Bacteroidales bacterium]
MQTELFESRHIGPRKEEIAGMLKRIGVNSLDELINKTISSDIHLKKELSLPEPVSEYQYLKELKQIASKNKIFRTYIGLGYYNTILPSVIKRNILENPSWYTSYTPYQAEISQGRLEALLNFQTMVMELTGMEIANASLLDEATAATEAMTMFYNSRSRDAVKSNANCFLVDKNTFPQTIDVLRTRANAFNIELVICDIMQVDFSGKEFGALIQYPNSEGNITDYKATVEKAHQNNVPVSVAADLLSLTLLTPPGEWGADVVLGSTQRFGIPMGFGGPHAAYFATKESFKRNMPGRIIGVSVDARGKRALRMALQTREQHIKRERATSNICTAQALLATMAGMYAVYHGPEGLTNIASNIHKLACLLSYNLSKLGLKNSNKNFFDTLKIELPANISVDKLKQSAVSKEINFRYEAGSCVYISIDETTSTSDIQDIFSVFASVLGKSESFDQNENVDCLDQSFRRTSEFLNLDVFNQYHSETEMMRYIKMLERKDISLTHSMISLGSCTMKLNAATEMLPLSWPEFAELHPFVPTEQAEGYHILINQLESALKEITGFEAVSFQPNSGAAGEYTGLMVIREYHKQHDQAHRNIILIPSSAHGTNPASAVMAGFSVVVVDCDDKGNIKLDHLNQLATQHKDDLAGFMVTYPSTHGVFESAIIKMTEIVHANGGLVYMDGANMNAQVGITNPATIGADVCHLNLHKTFAIPHGGGGPGVGPIAVNKKLAPYLPSHPIIATGGSNGIHAVSAAPFGSASILVISHAYICMLGSVGLKEATKMAILNANYIAACLKGYYQVLYTGENGFVAHEMILDCRPFKQISDVTEGDIAKRLMDYGFHAPTLSFPVHGTLMIEPTESESLKELDRFVQTLISIHNEIKEVADSKADRKDNVLKNAPHTQDAVIDDNWNHSYPRNKAAFPLPWILENKFWPSVSRIDDAFGDRNLVCSCIPTENYKK